VWVSWSSIIIVLLDSGCTSDSVSPEFTTSANLKVHELEEPVPLQLGTVGSHSKINFGLFTNFKIGKTKDNHYFDIVNINRYNVILGTMFMRKHGIALDFEHDEVQVKGRVLDTIIKKPHSFKQARRHAMHPHPPHLAFPHYKPNNSE
jgi:Retroviral aspartyl protease